jgi:hypothetical protein
MGAGMEDVQEWLMKSKCNQEVRDMWRSEKTEPSVSNNMMI